MSENFRVAHCSDIHLDGDVYSTDKQSQSILFEKMLGEIKKRHPHLLLIAGDLFDSNRASKNIALWAMAVISALPFDVFIIPAIMTACNPMASSNGTTLMPFETCRCLKTLKERLGG